LGALLLRGGERKGGKGGGKGKGREERMGEGRGGKRKGAGEGRERKGKGLQPPQSKFSGYVADHSVNESQ